jgi:nitrite reductase (NADH) large subunit
MTSIPVHAVRRPEPWLVARWIGVALTVALLAALVLWPGQALHVLWDVAIPILPATFLINPLIWRNVCPLGTLNRIAGSRIGRRTLAVPDARLAWIVGIILLAVLVPGRRFVFNDNGPILAATIVAVALLAIGLGFVYKQHAGFCNALCPVLPVEKLYGQLPLIQIGNARCMSCGVCTPSGCIELARDKTVAQTLGPTRREQAWLRSSFGIFAASFPGFIAGYLTSVDGPLSAALGVYAHVGLYAVISYAVVATIVWAYKLRAEVALPLLAATAIGVYYWLGAPALAEANGLAQGVVYIRAAAVVLIGVWLWRARGRLVLKHRRAAV